MRNRHDRLIDAVFENTLETRDAADRTARATRDAAEKTAKATREASEAARDTAFDMAYEAKQLAEEQAAERRRQAAEQRAYAEAQAQKADSLRHRFLLFRQAAITANPFLSSDPDGIELRWREHQADQARQIRAFYDAKQADVQHNYETAQEGLNAWEADLLRAAPKTANRMPDPVLGASAALLILSMLGSGPFALITLALLIGLGSWHIVRYRRALATDPTLKNEQASVLTHLMVAAKALPVAAPVSMLVWIAAHEVFGSGPDLLVFFAFWGAIGLAIIGFSSRADRHGLKTELAALRQARAKNEAERRDWKNVSFEEYHDWCLQNSGVGTPIWANY